MPQQNPLTIRPIPAQSKLLQASNLALDEFYIEIPSTQLVIKGKYWKNGNARADLIETDTGTSKCLGKSLTQTHLQTLIAFALIPHKHPHCSKTFTAAWKTILIHITTIPF